MKQVYDLGEAALTLIHPCLTLRSEADLCLLEIGLSPLNRLANSMGSVYQGPVRLGSLNLVVVKQPARLNPIQQQNF